MMVTTVAAQRNPVASCTALERRLRAHVERLAEPRHLRAQPAANRRTRESIAGALVDDGYRVAIQGRYRNVIALPRGLAADPAALPAVCAHYDSVPGTPGADDNASAVAVMLEVARAAARRQVPVVAIAFNAEEDNLAGSREFVESYRREGLAGELRIEVAHVLEMVGFTAAEQRWPALPGWLARRAPTVGDFIGVAADRRSRRHLKRVLATARGLAAAPPLVGLQAYVEPGRWLPDIERSDHAPFWHAGLPALLWTDTAEFRSPHYHRPTDTPETLDYRFMARVSALLAASVGAPSVRDVIDRRQRRVCSV